MKTIVAHRLPGSNREGNIRTILLVLIFFLLGLAVGIFAFHHKTSPARLSGKPTASGKAAVHLSASTQALLRRLNAPVEIRYYSMLASSETSAALRAFARRVGRMLSEYERDSHGEITVTRRSALSNENADAASADGLQPFNLDKGEACYLGMAVVHDGRKVSLPRLSLEWQQAVEFDVSRAIERVMRPKPPANPLPATSPANIAAVRQVKRVIPNIGSVPEQEAIERLREAALKEFKDAATSMSSKLKQAQQRYRQAQTASEKAAALKNLRQVQSQQTAKLQEIASRLQAQIKAVKQLKSE